MSAGISTMKHGRWPSPRACNRAPVMRKGSISPRSSARRGSESSNDPRHANREPPLADWTKLCARIHRGASMTALGCRNCITGWSVMALAVAAAGCTSMRGDDHGAAAMRASSVIASPLRTAADRQTDAERHPAEFLPFTGVEPGMRVLDVSAGGGYTSQLLAIAVGPGGIVWAQSPKPGAALERRLADHPQRNLIVVARPFDDPVPPAAKELDLITLIQNCLLY